MNWLGVEALTKTFPGGITALNDISLSAARGEFFSIVGPTNAGKSTLLKTIAGLYRPDRGKVVLAGRDATLLEPRQRRLGFVFQNMALFPNRTGFDNIAFPLKVAGAPPAEIARRVKEIAERLAIAHVLARHPRTFSGGEQQRVAIGRALAASSQALLLDEPLTNLDARLRTLLRIDFKALHRETGQTILYVTHDQVEAFSLSDRIAVLNRGNLQQIGTPEEIYRHPVNRFVATFMGSPPMNILDAELSESDGAMIAMGEGFEVTVPSGRLAEVAQLPRRLAIGVRPEAVSVLPARQIETPFPTEVKWIERLGAKNILDIAVGRAIIKALVRPDHPVRHEGPAFFGFDAGRMHLLNPATDRFIHA
jgi:multiple sugar transport system ATP-binding protein